MFMCVRVYIFIYQRTKEVLCNLMLTALLEWSLSVQEPALEHNCHVCVVFCTCDRVYSVT